MAKGYFKYDWALIERYHDDGNGFVACRKRFGFAKASWLESVRCGRLVVRPRKWPLEKVLSDSKSRYTVKRRLLAAGLLKNICEQCGLTRWRRKPLTIQIDHRNGKRDDNRLENLRMLCPNCHSQTETYAARNRKRPERRGRESKTEIASDKHDGENSLLVIREAYALTPERHRVFSGGRSADAQTCLFPIEASVRGCIL